MADHGDNYKRITGKEGEEIGELGVECGHHCGVQPTAPGHTHTRHCGCVECHDDNSVFSEMPTILTSPDAKAGVDPRGII
jgi:hypothetical protein